MKSIKVKIWIIFLMLAVLASMLWPGATSSAAVLQSTGNRAISYLPEGGSISGHVYEADGNTPIAGVQVKASVLFVPLPKPTVAPTITQPTIVTAIPTITQLPTVTPAPTVPPAATVIATPPWSPMVLSASDGSYTISGLLSGNYTVYSYANGYIPEYYDGAYSSIAATQISVNAPDDTPGIDFTLDRGGTISGHIYTADGTAPIMDVWVFAELVPISASIQMGYLVTKSSSDGSYAITGLISGDYRVFADGNFVGFQLEYYEGASSRDTAKLVGVTAPEDTPGIEFTLQAMSRVALIIPNWGRPGTTMTGVLINGINFTGAIAVSFSGTGVTASDLVVNEAGTQITANVTIDNNAAPGNRAVTVTSPSRTGTLYGGFRVLTPPPPMVTSVVPNHGVPGATLTGVSINGTNLTGVTSVEFSGTGVTAGDLNVNEAGTRITANVTISGDATFGARDVTVSAPAGKISPLVGGFTVVSPFPPTLTSLLPNSDVPGATLQGILITGTNLTGVASINFSGTGVTASGLRDFIGAEGNKMLANITISSDASPGDRDVTVTTPAGMSAPLIDGFKVMANTGLPTVSVGLPATIPPGGTFDVSINATGVTNLAAWQFDLQYENAVIQVAGEQGGVAVTPGLIGTTTLPVDLWAFQPPDVPGNKIRGIGHFSGLGFVSGSGCLARIHFVVPGAAGTQSTLHLSEVKLFDIGANSRPLATIDGKVLVGNIKAFLAGDTNGDGITDISDVTILYRIILGLDPATSEADANGNGVIDMGDATIIERMILGLP